MESRRLEILLFPQVIKLYESDPDVADYYLEIVRSYSTGKTRDNRALDILANYIVTKEQAIDYIEACENLPKSIKEDNYLKLLVNNPYVYTEKGMERQGKWFASENKAKEAKEPIIAAFEEMQMSYSPLLPKNCFPQINTDIANKIYSNLSIVELAQMSMTSRLLNLKNSPLLHMFRSI